MRRAMRHGKKLGIEDAFLSELTQAVVDRMKAAYPELVSHADAVSPRSWRVEEERFGTHPQAGLRHLRGDRRPRCPAGGIVPGAEVFRLYDTYGLPVDFTEELARDRGLGVDAAGFERELAAQQERARAVEQDGRRSRATPST